MASVFSAALVFVGVVFLTYLGYIAPWSGRFYSLYDTGWVAGVAVCMCWRVVLYVLLWAVSTVRMLV